MTQQVNLYQPIFRKQKIVLPARAIAAVLLVAVVAFGAVGATFQVRLKSQAVQLSKLEKNKTDMAAQLEELKAKVPSMEKSKTLPLQIAELEAEQSLKQRALQLLGDTKLGNTKGFSGLMEGLAKRHVASVWLDHITIAAGGAEVSLVGRSRQAELVPTLLQALRAEPSFVGLNFDFLRMQRGQKEPELLHFYFGTTPIKGNEVASASGAADGAVDVLNAVQQHWDRQIKAQASVVGGLLQ